MVPIKIGGYNIKNTNKNCLNITKNYKHNTTIMSSVETPSQWIYDPSTGTYSLTCSQEYFNSIMLLLQQNNNGIQRLNDLVAELQQDNIYTHRLLNGETSLSPSFIEGDFVDSEVPPPPPPLLEIISTSTDKVAIDEAEEGEIEISTEPTPSFQKDPRIDLKKMESPKKKYEVYDGIKKTALCKWFMTKNYCRYGDKCNFAHGEEELRKKKDYSSRDSKYYKRSRDDYHDRRDRHDHLYSRDMDYNRDRDYSHVRRDKYERHSKKRRHSYHY